MFSKFKQMISWDRFDTRQKLRQPTCEVGSVWEWRGDSRIVNVNLSKDSQLEVVSPLQRFRVRQIAHTLNGSWVTLEATITGRQVVVKREEFSLQGIPSGFWEKES